jgi:hypothetical protein
MSDTCHTEPENGGDGRCVRTANRGLDREGARHAQHTASTQRRGRALRRCRRILAALPLVKRSADRDRHVQVALVHAVRSIAAGTVRPGERNSAA